MSANSSPPTRNARSLRRSERGHGPADRRQQLVAAGVAALVVDALEVVDVDQQERQRRAAPDGALELAGELLLERSVVAEAGQAVEQRILARPPVQLTQSRVLRRQPPDVAQERAEPARP